MNHEPPKYLIAILLAVGLSIAIAIPVAVQCTDAFASNNTHISIEVEKGETSSTTPPVAPSAAVASREQSINGVALALQNGHWFVAIGGAMLLLIGAVKKYAWEPSSRWGKYAMAGAMAGGAVLGLAWQSGAGLSWGLIGSAFVAMATAAWLYQGKRDVADA